MVIDRRCILWNYIYPIRASSYRQQPTFFGPFTFPSTALLFYSCMEPTTLQRTCDAILDAIDENAVEMRRTALHTTVQTTAQRRGTRTTTSPRKATTLIRVKIGTNILLYTLSAMHVNDARCYSSLSLLSASKDVSSSIQVLVANGDARPALPIFIRPARCYVDRPEHGGRRGNMASCRIRQVPSIVSKSRSMPCRSHHQRQQAG